MFWAIKDLTQENRLLDSARFFEQGYQVGRWASGCSGGSTQLFSRFLGTLVGGSFRFALHLCGRPFRVFDLLQPCGIGVRWVFNHIGDYHRLFRFDRTGDAFRSTIGILWRFATLLRRRLFLLGRLLLTALSGAAKKVFEIVWHGKYAESSEDRTLP
jgi:hypothetical protein